MSLIITKKDYYILYLLLGIVYLAGLGIPLMENDSAQHATMGMTMYLEQDFLNIYKGGIDYLDKPHMHFWLAGFAFKLFGISHWAYRIPAIIFTIIGAWSTGQLAKTFYGEQAKHIASLIFLSTQAILLANHDVRTDAVLTGAAMFSIWQLVMYINHNKLKHIIFGAIGLGIAFSTKGHLAVFIIGICILTHLAYTRSWRMLVSWKILIGILTLIISIAPVLYAYYVQFDLHPEKVIHGKSNVSGIKFIFWDQTFNRFTAEGFEKTNTDYFFFFHTLLWTFLPWSIIAYLALFSRLKRFFKSKFRYIKSYEILTSVGVFIVLIVMNLSKSKLPHYLNSLLPVLTVLVSGYLVSLFNNKNTKLINRLLIIQYITLALLGILVLFISFWAFPTVNILVIISLILLLIGLLYFSFKKTGKARKIIFISVYFMGLINFSLNTQFYPNLLNYEASYHAAKLIKKEGIDLKNVYKTTRNYSWALNFYTHSTIPEIELSEVKNLKAKQWVYVLDKHLNTLKSQNITWGKTYAFDRYRVSRLKWSFLNPKTRASALKKAYLIQIE